jgi:hypothetical protein
MALFGSVGKFFSKAFANPVVQVLFPPAAIGNILAIKGVSAIASVASPHAPTPSQVSHADQTHVFFEQGPQQGNIPQPYAPNYGGYQDPFANQQYGGQPSWAYSTPSPAFSTTPSPISQAGQVGRTWEDLTALAAPFL